MTYRYIDTGGRVSCPEHIGSYATAVLRKRPSQRTIVTPLTTWSRLNDEEIEELRRLIGIDEICEDCPPFPKQEE